MTRSSLLFGLAVTLTSVVGACGDDDGDPSADGGPNGMDATGGDGDGDGDGDVADLTITLHEETGGSSSGLRSGEIGSRSDALLPGDGPCEVDGTTGFCMRPSRLEGFVGAIWLTKDTGGPPIRLLGASVGLGVDQNGSLEAAPFDFADPEPLEGEDNLFEASPSDRFNQVGLNLALVDAQLPIHEEYWNFRFFFVTQPLSDDPALESCELSGSIAEGLPTNSLLFDEPLEAHRGDVMVCKKTNASDVCALGEYQWIDATTGALSATRPENALGFGEIIPAPICTNEGGRVGVGAQGHSVFSTLDEPISIWSEFGDGGCRSYFVPDEGGGMQTGTNVNVDLAFDTAGFFVFEGISDPEAAAEADLLRALQVESVIWQSRNNAGGSFPTFEVRAELTLGSSGDCGTDTSDGGVPDMTFVAGEDRNGDGMFTCYEFCEISKECDDGADLADCNEFCAAIEDGAEQGGCEKELSGVIECGAAATSCSSADCRDETMGIGACLMTYCGQAENMTNETCMVLATIFSD